LAWGKTGTAENYDNAWFDGFTPQLTTVVWMGSPIGNVPMDSVCGKTLTGNQVCPGVVFGDTIPAPIWQEYMSLALAGDPALTYPLPPSNMGDIFTVKDPPGSYGPPSVTTTTLAPGKRPGGAGAGGAGGAGTGGTTGAGGSGATGGGPGATSGGSGAGAGAGGGGGTSGGSGSGGGGSAGGGGGGSAGGGSGGSGGPGGGGGAGGGGGTKSKK
jgi:membrane peptidoglycan carboxypeptidase